MIQHEESELIIGNPSCMTISVIQGWNWKRGPRTWDKLMWSYSGDVGHLNCMTNIYG